MQGLNGALLGAVVVALLLAHSLAVALGKALRTYSRSRLEEVCEEANAPTLADAIAHNDDRTERSTEILSVLTGLSLVALGVLALGPIHLDSGLTVKLLLLALLAGLTHVAAVLIGRVLAEEVLSRLWPLAKLIRAATYPLTMLASFLESLLEKLAKGRIATARPASVEVEVHSANEEAEDVDADLPETTREMLERVIELARTDVSEVMTPRPAIVSLPASTSSIDAAHAFQTHGLSRIPLFGENRDDIVGVLYLKDLFASFVSTSDLASVSPRKLVRPPFFIPESKNAHDLLQEFRKRRTQIAVVLDEFGGVSGLVTLEDLLEELVGSIDDEHDTPTPEDPIVPSGQARFEIDATLSLEELNERLGLHLPTDEDYMTVGGLAFHELGAIPQPGATFRVDGVEFKIKEVEDHSIRRLEINLEPAPIEVAPPAQA